MANLFIYSILYNRVADFSNKMKKILSKLHKSSTSTVFIKKALHKNVTATFAKVQKLNTKKSLRKFRLNNHFNDIRDFRLEYNAVKDKLEGEIGSIFTNMMLKSIIKSLKRER